MCGQYGGFQGKLSSPAEKINIVFLDVLDELTGGRVGLMIGWFGADELLRFCEYDWCGKHACKTDACGKNG